MIHSAVVVSSERPSQTKQGCSERTKCFQHFSKNWELLLKCHPTLPTPSANEQRNYFSSPFRKRFESFCFFSCSSPFCPGFTSCASSAPAAPPHRAVTDLRFVFRYLERDLKKKRRRRKNKKGPRLRHQNVFFCASFLTSCLGGAAWCWGTGCKPFQAQGVCLVLRLLQEFKPRSEGSVRWWLKEVRACLIPVLL